VLAAASPLLSDAVIAAPDKAYLGLLAWPNIDAARKLCPDAAGSSDSDVLARFEVVDYLRQALRRYNEGNTGTGSRIERALLLAEAPNIDIGEITDKGYINQRIALATTRGGRERSLRSQSWRQRHRRLTAHMAPRCGLLDSDLPAQRFVVRHGRVGRGQQPLALEDRVSTGK
jgi:hypothetical protein